MQYMQITMKGSVEILNIYALYYTTATLKVISHTYTAGKDPFLFINFQHCPHTHLIL